VAGAEDGAGVPVRESPAVTLYRTLYSSDTGKWYTHEHLLLHRSAHGLRAHTDAVPVSTGSHRHDITRRSSSV